MEQCHRNGLSVFQAAYSDAGHASTSARQGISALQVASHGSRTQHQFLQGTVSPFCAVCCALLDLSACCAYPGPPLRWHHPALVTPPPGKVQHLICPQQTTSDPLQQAAQEAPSRPNMIPLFHRMPAVKRPQAPRQGQMEDRSRSVRHQPRL